MGARAGGAGKPPSVGLAPCHCSHHGRCREQGGSYSRAGCSDRKRHSPLPTLKKKRDICPSTLCRPTQVKNSGFSRKLGLEIHLPLVLLTQLAKHEAFCLGGISLFREEILTPPGLAWGGGTAPSPCSPCASPGLPVFLGRGAFGCWGFKAEHPAPRLNPLRGGDGAVPAERVLLKVTLLLFNQLECFCV